MLSQASYGALRRSGCRSLVVAGLAAFALSGVLAPVAVAAPADVFHGFACQTDLPPGFTACSEGHSVFDITTSPSGNVSITDISRLTFTLVTPDGCNVVSSGTFTAHTLFKAGSDAFAEDHALAASTTVLSNCNGVPVVSCVSTEHFHFANGAFQYEDFTFDCTPVTSSL